MINRILTLIPSRDWNDGISADALPSSFPLLQSQRPKIKKKGRKKEKSKKEKSRILLDLNSVEVVVFRTEISFPALHRGNASDIPTHLGFRLEVFTPLEC